MEHNTIRHIIHRQVFDLTIRSKQEGWNVQERLKNAFYESLPSLETVFSNYDDPDFQIQFDSISIDIGVLTPDISDGEFSARLCNAMMKTLRDSIRSDISKKNRAIDRSPGEGPEKSLSAQTKELKISLGSNDWSASSETKGISEDTHLVNTTVSSLTSIPEFYSKRDSVSMTFLYFLVNGVYPWWSDVHTVEKGVSVFYNLPDNADNLFVTALKKYLKNDNNALRRLLYRFPDLFVEKLTRLLIQYTDKEVVNLCKIIKDEYERIRPPVLSDSLISGDKWVTLKILMTDNVEEAVSFLTRFLDQLTEHDCVSAESIVSVLKTESMIAYGITEKLSEITSERHSASIKEHGRKAEQYSVTNDNDRDIISVQLSDKEDIESEASDKFLFIDLAGLVIVHPFLSQFFGELGLLNDNQQFINGEARIKAVHLLAYLATGKKNVTESKLPFCKFLCGMPLKEAIPENKAFNIKEMKESKRLLKSLISHWSILKNTSIQGLREGFLSRKGKLDFQEETVMLFVESKSHDVLLDMLPWGISFISLPWMDKPFSAIWN